MTNSLWKYLTGLPLDPLHERARRAIFFFITLISYCIVLHSPSSQSQAQVAVDQIVCIINGEAITRLDLIWSLALDPNAPAPSGPRNSDLLKQKLEVAIDEKLLLQEAGKAPTIEISAGEIEEYRTKLIKAFQSETVFRQRTGAAGLTSRRIEDLIRQRIVILKFVDFRFKSFIFVQEQDITRYYNEKYVQSLRSKGEVPPSYEEVKNKIIEILKEEKINEAIDRWLQETRQRADIVQIVEP